MKRFLLLAGALGAVGLVERINIGTLQTWTFVTSIALFKDAGKGAETADKRPIVA